MSEGRSVDAVEPLGEHVAIAVGLLHKAHVKGAVEELPLRVGNGVVHELGNERCAHVVGAAHDEARCRNLAQAVDIVKVLERSQWGVLVGAPSCDVGRL